MLKHLPKHLPKRCRCWILELVIRRLSEWGESSMRAKIELPRQIHVEQAWV